MSKKRRPRVTREMIWVTGPIISTFIFGGGIMSLVTNNPVWVICISISCALVLLWISVRAYQDAGDMDAEQDEAFREEAEALEGVDPLPGLWSDEPQYIAGTRRVDPHQHGEGA